MGAIGVEVLGMAAALLGIVSGLPQLLKTARTRRARDVSLPFWAVLLAANLMWAAYGLSVGGAPLVLSSVATLFICLAMIALTLRYGGRSQRRKAVGMTRNQLSFVFVCLALLFAGLTVLLNERWLALPFVVFMVAALVSARGTERLIK